MGPKVVNLSGLLIEDKIDTFAATKIDLLDKIGYGIWRRKDFSRY